MHCSISKLTYFYKTLILVIITITTSAYGLTTKELATIVRWYNKGYYMQAKEKIIDAIWESPTNPLLWQYLYKCYYKLGMEEAYRHALERYYILTKDSSAKHKLYQPKGKLYERICTIKGIFKQPKAVVCDISGNIYIADVARHSIICTDYNGTEKFLIPTRKLPIDITLIGKKLYVVDYLENIIDVYDTSNRKRIFSFGGGGIGDGKFLGCKAITADENFIYTIDDGNKRIQKFTVNGRFLFSFPWEFNDPKDIEVVANRVWVLDGNELISFDTFGNFIGIKKIAVEAQRFTYAPPYFVLIDSIGKILFFDITQDKYYQYIMRFNSAVNVWRQKDIGFVYVADEKNGCIHILKRKDKKIFVWIDRVIEDAYPLVVCTVKVSVDGIPLNGLNEKNIRLIEQGRQAFPLGISEVTEKYVSVAVVVEDTIHLHDDKENIKNLLDEFIDNLSGWQNMEIVSFSEEVKVLQTFTTNKLKLYKAVDRLSYNRSLAKLSFVKAIYKISQDFQRLYSHKWQPQLFVVVIAKSIDKNNYLLNALLYLLRTGAQLVIIDYTHGGVNDTLKFIADKTKGSYYNFAALPNLYKIIQRQGERLGHYNILWYKSKSRVFADEYVSIRLDAGFGRLYASDRCGYPMPYHAGIITQLER